MTKKKGPVGRLAALHSKCLDCGKEANGLLYCADHAGYGAKRSEYDVPTKRTDRRRNGWPM